MCESEPRRSSSWACKHNLLPRYTHHMYGRMSFSDIRSEDLRRCIISIICVLKTSALRYKGIQWKTEADIFINFQENTLICWIQKKGSTVFCTYQEKFDTYYAATKHVAEGSKCSEGAKVNANTAKIAGTL